MGYQVTCNVCGAKMTKKSDGMRAFYGCSNWPECDNTMTIREAQLSQDQDDWDDPDDFEWD